MKKFQYFAASLLVGFALTACTGSEELETVVAPVEQAEQVEAEVELVLTVNKGAAGARALTGTAEDSGIHEEVTADEFEIKTARLFFIDADGVVVMTKDYTMTPDQHNASDDHTSQYWFSANDKSRLYTEGTYKVYAVANPGVLPTVGTEAELLEVIDASTYAAAKLTQVPAKGFMMTNRGNEAQEDVVIKRNNKATIHLEVERVVAKIRLNYEEEGWNLVHNGETYCGVRIVQHSFVNLQNDFYLFRHTTTHASDLAEVPAKGVIEYAKIAAGTGYAVDPHFYEKTVASAKAGVKHTFLSYPYNNVSLAADEKTIYCLPNTMYHNAELNNHTTGIQLTAALTPTAVYDATGGTVQDSYYAYYFNYKFYSTLEAAKAQGNLSSKCEDNPESLKKYNVIKFTKSQTANAFTTRYWYWIRHYNDEIAGNLGVMEFGIVRNNIYDVTVKSILGPGNPDPTDPDDPDDWNIELDVELGVKPWIVRPQDAILD